QFRSSRQDLPLESRQSGDDPDRSEPGSNRQIRRFWRRYCRYLQGPGYVSITRSRDAKNRCGRLQADGYSTVGNCLTACVVLNAVPRLAARNTIPRSKNFGNFLGPIQILPIQLFMLVIQLQRLAFDEYLFYFGTCFERISVSNHYVRPLTFFNGAELVGDAPNLGGVQGHGFQS